MKKNKFLLIAIFVMAAMGSMLAFKARKNYGGGNVYTLILGTTCTGLDIWLQEDMTATPTIIGTTTNGGRCTTLHVTLVE